MRLTVNRVTYHVEVEGSGPAVFFLHGVYGQQRNLGAALGGTEGVHDCSH